VSVRGTARALPTLLRIGVIESLAYRTELLVWVLTTTMPLIMLALWSAVARDGPVGRYGQAEFTAYFLAVFIVRQVTGSWVAWEMNLEIREGRISSRLLRPVHPLLTYGIEVLAALPLRAAIALPAAVAALWLVGGERIPRDPVVLLAWLLALVGAWSISYLANACIGCLAFFADSAIRVMDLWLVLFYVFGGYLIPVELFPPALATAARWLPFRYQLGLPVELITASHDRTAALELLAAQWSWVAMLGLAAAALWRVGLRRHGAFGG
jgi:ABC-2 type transport system permease protein